MPDSLDIVDSPRGLNQLSGEHYTITMADDAGPYEVTISLLNISLWCPTLLFEILPKKLTGLAGGSVKVKIWPGMGLAYIYIYLAWEPSRGPKWIKDP